MTRIALGTAALLLALLDWTAGSTIAEPEGPNDGPPPDEMVPADARLEGMFRATAEIDSVAFRVVPAAQGYVLEAANPGTVDRDVEVEVKVLETSVNPMARMGPIPQEVVSEKVALHCPAGQRIRHALQLAGLEPASPANPRTARAASNAGSNANAVAGLGGLQSFRTREFLIARATPPAQRQARAPAAAFLARPAGQTVLRFALGPSQPRPSAAAQ